MNSSHRTNTGTDPRPSYHDLGLGNRPPRPVDLRDAALPRPRRRFLPPFGSRWLLLWVLVSCGAGCWSLQAQTWVGLGTDDNWSTTGNWNPSGPLNNGSAEIVFAGGVRLTPVVDAPWEVRSIRMDATALGFGISGAPLGIGSMGIRNDSAVAQALGNNVILRGPQTWGAAAGPLSFGGAVATEGHVLTVRGAQQTSLLGPVSGTGGILKLDAGVLRLMGTNTFTGGVVLNEGVLVLGSDTALGGGTFFPLAGIVRAEGASRTLANAVVAGSGALPRFDSPLDATWTGPVTLDGNREWRVDNSGVVTLSGILGQAANPTSLTKLGTGTLVFSGATPNTLAGPVHVVAGSLRLSKTAGTDAVAGDLVIGGGSTAAATRWDANNQVADTAHLKVNPLGLVDLNGFSETLQELEINGGEVTTGAGVLTLGGITGLSSDTTGQISGQLSLGGMVRVIALVKGTSPVDLRITATIADGGLVKSGSGVLVLTGANRFAEGFTLVGGILGVGHDLAAGTGPLRLGIGKIQAEGAPRTLTNVVQLGVFYGIAEPTFAGSEDLTFSGPVLLGGTPVWTVENTGRTIFSGPIGEPQPGGGLSKVGPGTLVFTGGVVNNYTGPTAVREGALLLNKAAGVQAIPGLLDIGGATAPALVRLGANEQIANGSPVLVRKAGLLDLNGFVETGILALEGGSVDTGAGQWILVDDLLTGVSDATATITGAVDLGGAPRTFSVADGPQPVDLHIAAGLSNGTIYKSGAGRLVLAGNSSFAGGVALVSGSLGVGTDQALGSGPLQLASSAAGLSAESGARTLANPVRSVGNITIEGANDLLLTGPWTLFGKTALIVENRTMVAGAIGESGGAQRLVKQGPGTLVLAGANSFTGGFLVEGGRLELRHVNAAGAGLLVADAATVVLGGIADTVESGSTALSSNTVTLVRLGQPRSNALLRANGVLSLSGRLDIQAEPGFGTGLHRLMEYTGAVGVQGFNLGSTPPGFSCQLILTNPGRVDLSVASAVPLEINCPAGLEVNCLGEVPAPDVNLVEVLQAGCGSVVRSLESETFGTNGTAITITRHYRVTDSCNQVATCTQAIVVNQGNAAPPSLTLSRQETQLVICWDHPCSVDFVLEETTSLIPPVEWNLSATAVPGQGNERCVTVQAVGNKFFRLRSR